MSSADLLSTVVSFKDWAVWVLLGVVAAFGALGGWAHQLVLPADNKRPRPHSIVVGAVAALGVLFVVGAEDPVKVVAVAVVAGYGGKSILDALENRLKVVAAEKDREKAQEQGLQAVAVGREAISFAQKLGEQPHEPYKADQAASETWKGLVAQLDRLENSLKK